MHGGRDRGGQGGHGPSNNLVGGAILYLAPQYFALEFKILCRNTFRQTNTHSVTHSIHAGIAYTQSLKLLKQC